MTIIFTALSVIAAIVFTALMVAMSGERLEVSVTFDSAKGYVALVPDLAEPITALSLAGLPRRIEERLLPDKCRGAAHARPRRPAGAETARRPSYGNIPRAAVAWLSDHGDTLH
jgi:hypothetical protein